MFKYESRLNRLQRKVPRQEMGNFDIWLENEDGTLTGPGGLIMTQEEFDRQSEDELTIIIGDPEWNRAQAAKWRSGGFDK